MQLASCNRVQSRCFQFQECRLFYFEKETNPQSSEKKILLKNYEISKGRDKKRSVIHDILTLLLFCGYNTLVYVIIQSRRK